VTISAEELAWRRTFQITREARRRGPICPLPGKDI